MKEQPDEDIGHLLPQADWDAVNAERDRLLKEQQQKAEAAIEQAKRDDC